MNGNEKTPDIRFYTKPSNSSRTFLSGFLEENGYFIVQVLPSKESGKVILSLESVQLNIFKPVENNTFGYYELCFHKTKDNIPEYINNLIRIDEIRIIGDNIDSSSPVTNREGVGKNTLVFDSGDDNISVSIIRDESFTDIISGRDLAIIFIAGLLAVLSFILNIRDKLITRVEDHKDHYIIITVLSILALLFVFIILPYTLLVVLRVVSDITAWFSTFFACCVVLYSAVPILNIARTEARVQKNRNKSIEAEPEEDDTEPEEDDTEIEEVEAEPLKSIQA